MRTSKFYLSIKRQFGVLLVGFVTTCGGSVMAEDDWKPRNGVDGLRPASGAKPFANFLTARQLDSQQLVAANQTETAQVTDETGRAAAAQSESYKDWLDEADLERVTRVREGHFHLPVLSAPAMSTDQVGNGRVPQGFRSGEVSPTRPLPETSEFRGTHSWTLAHWTASNMYSNPRYFEDRMLERHGHERFPRLTPMISGARFFATVPMLPYLMALSHGCEPELTVG